MDADRRELAEKAGLTQTDLAWLSRETPFEMFQ